MSSLITRSAFQRAAEAEVGTKEGWHNATKYGRWFADLWNDRYFANASYCAMGLSWLARDKGKDSLLGYFASCSAWVRAFQAEGRFYSTPKVGDLVFYTFSHVELVTKVSTRYIGTIGFNTSSGVGSQRDGDGVYRRTRARNSLIRGYGRPRYAPEPANAPVTKVSGVDTVKTWQGLLKFAPSRRDGLFGPATDQRGQWMRVAATHKDGTLAGSAKSTIQLIQRIVGTPDDGAWGPASRKAITEWTQKVQRFLGVTADGDWGPKTDAAYLAFRKAHRL